MLPVRVFYAKDENVSYISHLDLQRSVFRAINRSGLNPVYTEGFNPHIKATFACPLSVFQKSGYEIFDFFVLDELSYEEITQRLKTAFPRGLEVIKAEIPVKDLKEIALADYVINLKTPLTAEDIENMLSGKIDVVKKTKKGDVLTDISPLIKSKTFVKEENGVKLYIRCACGTGEHLNLRYLIEFLSDSVTDYDIIRNMLYDGDGNIFC